MCTHGARMVPKLPNSSGTATGAMALHATHKKQDRAERTDREVPLVQHFEVALSMTQRMMPHNCKKTRPNGDLDEIFHPA